MYTYSLTLFVETSSPDKDWKQTEIGIDSVLSNELVNFCIWWDRLYAYVYGLCIFFWKQTVWTVLPIKVQRETKRFCLFPLAGCMWVQLNARTNQMLTLAVNTYRTYPFTRAVDTTSAAKRNKLGQSKLSIQFVSQIKVIKTTSKIIAWTSAQFPQIRRNDGENFLKKERKR